LVALVGYEEKNGKWQSVDIRIAPGVEEKDFQKFSKVLHIKKMKQRVLPVLFINFKIFMNQNYEKKKMDTGLAYEYDF
ncbi:hypothetical protein LIZ53_16630, partial [Lachnoclostridium sp. 210928-DFI.6.3]|nr:hypothetical protein [Lachnoclostridium sp. 210928-DFI.6.3]